MEKYIPLDAVVAEIERRIKIFQKNPYENHKAICHLDSLKQFLNTLEVKEVQEVHVSEELEEAPKEYGIRQGAELRPFATKFFKAGAKWQKEQFEKNRLADCDKMTEEEAEIESDFCIGIIESENRQPTFDDAIKYGMRLQKEQMMAKAFPVEIDSSRSDGRCILSGNFARFETGDKVKVIVIKEE